MTFRPFEIGRDYPEICEWWRARGWKGVGLSLLPNLGIVVEEEGVKLCAGFLYTSNSRLGWIEWVVTNPESPLKSRRRAIDTLIEEGEKALRFLGVESVFVQLKSRGLMKVYEAHGFSKGDTEMTHYSKRLV